MGKIVQIGYETLLNQTNLPQSDDNNLVIKHSTKREPIFFIICGLNCSRTLSAAACFTIFVLLILSIKKCFLFILGGGAIFYFF